MLGLNQNNCEGGELRLYLSIVMIDDDEAGTPEKRAVQGERGGDDKKGARYHS